jgi:hypothetical protein
MNTKEFDQDFDFQLAKDRPHITYKPSPKVMSVIEIK